jgi:hypothetical protein
VIVGLFGHQPVHGREDAANERTLGDTKNLTSWLLGAPEDRAVAAGSSTERECR